ncbi:SAM-dependent methyltransferase [Streptomyces sp. NRRL F-5126]|uniref:SAM-dependent methyltransferase n=1 Tax=Streptomyces sp. NRRL F-5126 TaxID=1463857 RepID=UPI000692564D|nr:class I SAM-dependent methyltransferase [Streptomyces sp. NRRL F-5126]
MNSSVEHDDPVSVLEGRVWAFAAAIATLREAAADSLAKALESDPERTAVLEAAGLVRREGDGVVTAEALRHGPDTANAASARLSALRQAVDAAVGEGGTGWDSQRDDVLLDQGRASAATGHALVERLVPALPGLADRLAVDGSVLDIGTGTGALALALAQDLPHVRVTGIDILERAIRLAHRQLDGTDGGLADRIELRHQDAADLRERNTYDLIWLPAPFLSDGALRACLPHVARALRDGGWLVAGTNPEPREPLLAAVARWTATRNGGSAVTADRMAEELERIGFRDLRRILTVPGGPLLVVGRRADRVEVAS